MGDTTYKSKLHGNRRHKKTVGSGPCDVGLELNSFSTTAASLVFSLVYGHCTYISTDGKGRTSFPTLVLVREPPTYLQTAEAAPPFPPSCWCVALPTPQLKGEAGTYYNLFAAHQTYRFYRLVCASYVWDFLQKRAKPTFCFDPRVSGIVEGSPAASASTGNVDFSQYQGLIKARPALHIAVRAGHVKVVEELVKKLSPKDLKQENNEGRTPLALAALNGFKEIAQCMIKKNTELTSILDKEGILPVVRACNRGKKEVTRLLYNYTPPKELGPKKGEGKNGATLLVYCIATKFLDIALHILEKHPSLAVTLDKNGVSPLYILGQKPSLFKSGSQLWFWQRWIYSCISVNVDCASDWIQINVVDNIAQGRDDRNNTKKGMSLLQIDNFKVPLIFLIFIAGLGQLMHGLVSYPQKLPGIKNIHDQKLMHAQAIKILGSICIELQNMKVDVLGFQVHQAVFQAVKRGNVEFVTETIKSIPELAWSRDINGRNIFFIAILNRQEKIFNLLHGLTHAQKMKVISPLDRFRNNMLHLVAMLAPSEQLDGISGAALQMQRELQWFKEVESIVPPLFKDLTNSDGKKASEVFSQQHADLVKEGEKWMKEIATSSTFVAALIVTIMFAAAFTIPGGNNDKGAPIFLDDTFFIVFIISDSISLFSATTSVLMFLGILTSVYAENKFLTRLPTKLIIGLSALFISIAAMMIAFCAALAVLLKESSTKVVMIPIILLACVPVTLFALLQFPLLVNIFISTYGPGIFDRNIERWY
ncbi:hypothetical protein CK203_044168 [Vitis vinifera]|uniref:PGG domain-containing protein n=1 Tax=Vitis vinifera TaxID=29760 RepID=A0A438I2N0_VITVI|nr:hypothetical protein CK203_044168 [Vitis vinifera]